MKEQVQNGCLYKSQKKCSLKTEAEKCNEFTGSFLCYSMTKFTPKVQLDLLKVWNQTWKFPLRSASFFPSYLPLSFLSFLLISLAYYFFSLSFFLCLSPSFFSFMHKLNIYIVYGCCKSLGTAPRQPCNTQHIHFHKLLPNENVLHRLVSI